MSAGAGATVEKPPVGFEGLTETERKAWIAKHKRAEGDTYTLGEMAASDRSAYAYLGGVNGGLSLIINAVDGHAPEGTVKDVLKMIFTAVATAVVEVAKSVKADALDIEKKGILQDHPLSSDMPDLPDPAAKPTYAGLAQAIEGVIQPIISSSATLNVLTPHMSLTYAKVIEILFKSISDAIKGLDDAAHPHHPTHALFALRTPRGVPDLPEPPHGALTTEEVTAKGKQIAAILDGAIEAEELD